MKKQKEIESDDDIAWQIAMQDDQTPKHSVGLGTMIIGRLLFGKFNK